MSNELMKEMGIAIEDSIPRGFGYALLVFPFRVPGITNYISNAKRADMIKELREAADRLERNQYFKTNS